MKITALVEALVAAGATPEMILAAVRTTESANEMALELAREKTRARVAKWRETRAGNVTDGHVTRGNGSRAGTTRVEDKTSNLSIEPQEHEERNARKRASPDSEFDAFWSKYPHKVGKPVAKAKFVAARKRASIDAIMAGLERYVAKTDDRPWCNPATWLHQDRWADQPATVIPLARGSPSKLAPVDHFRNLASELNGQDRSDRGVGGNWDDAPRLPLRTIEHHG